MRQYRYRRKADRNRQEESEDTVRVAKKRGNEHLSIFLTSSRSEGKHHVQCQPESSIQTSLIGSQRVSYLRGESVRLVRDGVLPCRLVWWLI